MSFTKYHCRITVLKRTHNGEALAGLLDPGYAEMGACDHFQEGRQFIADMPWSMPEGFCAWAWADIRKEIMAVMTGATQPGMARPGTAIAGCTDWLRPVLFLLERVEIAQA